MAFSVNLFLDEKATRQIQALWDRLAERQLALHMRSTVDRPHVTLAIFDELNVPAAQLAMVRYAQDLTVIPIRMPSLGVFPGPHGSIYLAVTVTETLLDLHAGLHRSLERFGARPWAIYRPGLWMPHCTLAMDLATEAVPPAVAACLEGWQPVEAVLEEIGISQFQPLQHVCRLPLPHHAQPIAASQPAPQPARSAEILRAWRAGWRRG